MPVQLFEFIFLHTNVLTKNFFFSSRCQCYSHYCFGKCKCQSALWYQHSKRARKGDFYSMVQRRSRNSYLQVRIDFYIFCTAINHSNTPSIFQNVLSNQIRISRKMRRGILTFFVCWWNKTLFFFSIMAEKRKNVIGVIKEGRKPQSKKQKHCRKTTFWHSLW